MKWRKFQNWIKPKKRPEWLEDKTRGGIPACTLQHLLICQNNSCRTCQDYVKWTKVDSVLVLNSMHFSVFRVPGKVVSCYNSMLCQSRQQSFPGFDIAGCCYFIFTLSWTMPNFSVVFFQFARKVVTLKKASFRKILLRRYPSIRCL